VTDANGSGRRDVQEIYTVDRDAINVLHFLRTQEGMRLADLIVKSGAQIYFVYWKNQDWCQILLAYMTPIT